MRRLIYLFIAIIGITAYAQRRVTPVNTAATRTQARHDAAADSARALEQRRARSVHYHDDQGNIFFVDTITGIQWVDSTMLPKPPKMRYPLLTSVIVGVDLWDPLMRAFGNKYGGFGISGIVSLHNRYQAVLDFGIGTAKKTPDTSNYTYRSPVAPYFKLGLDYNFLFNSNPDYQFYAGVRYGFSAFRFSIDDVYVAPGYWDDASNFNIPSTSATAGWFELRLGLRVKLVDHLQAGWAFGYHSILHQSHPATGDPWYIPGFGTKSSPLTGSFSLFYTFSLGKKAADTDLPAVDLTNPTNPTNRTNPTDLTNPTQLSDQSDKQGQ